MAVTVKLGGKPYPVAAVRFGSKNPGAESLAEWGRDLAPGTLGLGDTAIEFLTLGPAEADGENHTLEAVGLALPRALVTWFGGPADPNGGAGPLLYQRTAADGGVWPFVRRVCGHRLAVPINPPAAALLPLGACLWRDPAWDNQTFLELVVGWLRSRDAGVLGWRAVAAEADPIRLIPASPPVAAIGPEWGCPAAAFPHRLARRPEPCLVTTEFEAGSPGPLFQSLAAGATPSAAAGAGQLNGRGKAVLVAAPGPVRIGARTAFAQSVCYSIPNTKVPTRVAVDVELTAEPPPPPAEPPPRLLFGHFAAWAEPASKGGAPDRVSLHTADGAWGVVAEPDAGPDPAVPLVAVAAVPKTRKAGDHAGVYVAHRDGDPMAFVVHCGEVPLVVGSPQIQIPPYDAADVTVYGTKLAFDVSAKAAAADKMNGLHLDGAQSLAVLRFAPDGGAVTVDGGRGVVEVAAAAAFLAHAGPDAAGKDRPNVFALDAKAGKARVEGKSAATVAIAGKGQIAVTANDVGLMQNVIVRGDKTTMAKDVTVKGNLDMK